MRNYQAVGYLLGEILNYLEKIEGDSGSNFKSLRRTIPAEPSSLLGILQMATYAKLIEQEIINDVTYYRIVKRKTNE